MKVLSKAENAYDVIDQLWLHNRDQPMPEFHYQNIESKSGSMSWNNFLTDCMRQIQLWCPRSKLNMDDFSVLGGPYICVDATQEKEWNSLHALMGIGKGEGLGIICIR